MLNAYDGIEGYPLRTARNMLQKEIQLQKANDAGLHNVTTAELEDLGCDSTTLVGCNKCCEPVPWEVISDSGLCPDCEFSK